MLFFPLANAKLTGAQTHSEAASLGIRVQRMVSYFYFSYVP